MLDSTRTTLLGIIGVLAVTVIGLVWMVLSLLERTRVLEARATAQESVQRHFGEQLATVMSRECAPSALSDIGDFPPWRGKVPRQRQGVSPGLEGLDRAK